MRIGGSESAAPRGDTPIRPVHGKSMESASHSLIGTSCASADRSPPLRGAILRFAPCTGSQWKALRIHSLAPHAHRRIGVRRSEGRYPDSPRAWEANEKRFAFTHWHLMRIGGSECRASDSEPSQIAKRITHGRRQSAAPCCFHTREPPWRGARVSGFALGGF
jgi:hypothetical protein